MSSKSKRNGSKEADVAPTQAATAEAQLGNSAPGEEIRRRAYEIYLERGEQQGRELEDWLQAERELERGVLWREQAS
jgi:outer membrane protein TolC